VKIWCVIKVFIFLINQWFYLFCLQGCCLVLTVVCVFVCLVASTFPVIHIVKMYGYHHCEDKNNDCLCYGSPDPLSRQFTYKQLGNCDILYCLVKIFFIVQSGLCALGSGISFWFAILLWKSQYGGVYSGMRYSFNSHTNVDVDNNVWQCTCKAIEIILYSI
jgi:hypothetical protein